MLGVGADMRASQQPSRCESVGTARRMRDAVVGVVACAVARGATTSNPMANKRRHERECAAIHMLDVAERVVAGGARASRSAAALATSVHLPLAPRSGLILTLTLTLSLHLSLSLSLRLSLSLSLPLPLTLPLTLTSTR